LFFFFFVSSVDYITKFLNVKPNLNQFVLFYSVKKNKKLKKKQKFELFGKQIHYAVNCEYEL